MRSEMRRAGTAALLAIALVGCSGGPGELLATAQLEETQSNPDHARELYREIARRWPGSAAAERAAERLRVLGQPAPR